MTEQYYRSGTIDNIYQGGGARHKKRRKRRKVTRRKCNICNKPIRKSQRGKGLKKKLFGKALSFLDKISDIGLDFLSNKIKNKKVKALLNNSIVRKVASKGSQFIENKGDKWANE